MQWVKVINICLTILVCLVLSLPQLFNLHVKRICNLNNQEHKLLIKNKKFWFFFNRCWDWLKAVLTALFHILKKGNSLAEGYLIFRYVIISIFLPLHTRVFLLMKSFVTKPQGNPLGILKGEAQGGRNRPLCVCLWLHWPSPRAEQYPRGLVMARLRTHRWALGSCLLAASKFQSLGFVVRHPGLECWFFVLLA